MNTGRNKRAERRIREKLDRRQEILFAARETFFARGYKDSTVDEIADRCGLAKGTIYLYFSSKEDMYVSVMSEGMGLLKAELSKTASRHNHKSGPVESALEAYQRFYSKNPEYFRIMFLSRHPDITAKVSPDVRTKCVALSRECLGSFAELIKTGIDAGLYRPLDPWSTANILWSTATAIIMNYELDPVYRDEIAGVSLVEMLAQSLDIVLTGLRRNK